MTNKEAIGIIKIIREDYIPRTTFQEVNEALDTAIKAIDVIEQLKNMRDNAYCLYKVEKGDDDYSYGRKQVLGTVHSDLEELLEVFKEAENETS